MRVAILLLLDVPPLFLCRCEVLPSLSGLWYLLLYLFSLLSCSPLYLSFYLSLTLILPYLSYLSPHSSLLSCASPFTSLVSRRLLFASSILPLSFFLSDTLSAVPTSFSGSLVPPSSCRSSLCGRFFEVSLLHIVLKSCLTSLFPYIIISFSLLLSRMLIRSWRSAASPLPTACQRSSLWHNHVESAHCT